jgi:hypothetical protein
MGGRIVLEFTGPESLVHGHPLSGYNRLYIKLWMKYNLLNNVKLRFDF